MPHIMSTLILLDEASHRAKPAEGVGGILHLQVTWQPPETHNPHRERIHWLGTIIQSSTKRVQEKMEGELVKIRIIENPKNFTIKGNKVVAGELLFFLKMHIISHVCV